jgi:phospholipid/cholesterol/gamma-HCH transport system substrate-binding protein
VTPALRRIALVLVVAVLGSAAGCTRQIPGQSDTMEVRAQFARSFNVFPGSDVRVLGVDVGRVTDVYVRDGAAEASVKMAIRRDVPLPRNVRAIIVPQALLGERYIQLFPPYTGGPRLGAGAFIRIDHTSVPAEFDEVLESLNAYLAGLDEDEVARLVTNLAQTLDGQGDELGQTLESARQAVDVLRDNDDALIALAARLSDLNEIVATRDQELGALIEDWNTLARSLADDGDDIDAALSGVARLTLELAGFLEANRTGLETDIAVLARVGRTAQRNLDQIALSVHAQSELYRHAERVMDFDSNWLPLIEHAEELPAAIADRLNNRLAGVCIRLGIDECSTVDFWEQRLPGELCLPPVFPCPARPAGSDPVVTVPEALRDALELVPELEQGLREEAEQQRNELDEVVDLPEVTGARYGLDAGVRP